MHLFSQFLFGVALVSAQTFEEIFANMQAHQLRFGPLPIAYSRIDAIVNPGVDILSGHLHTIIGPDTFNSNSTSDQLRTGKCTSVNAGSSNSDMSAYWSPGIHYVHQNGTYTTLPMKDGTVYYNMYSNVTIRPFPQNFQMITGTATALNGVCPGGPGGKGYFYHDSKDVATLPRTFTKTIGFHITFPDCWDGQPFTKATQSQHMEYSAFDIGFPCPNPSWIKLPQIVLSFNFETPGPESDYPTNPNGPTYVLSTGDQYGCSLHADFMMGWQSGKLQQVIDECSSLGFGNTANCPVFDMSSGSDKLASSCKYSKSIPDENIGLITPASTLPGCLLIDGKLAPGCKTAVDFVNPVAFVDTQYRSAGWPVATTTGMAASGPTPTGSTSIFVCKQTTWGGPCNTYEVSYSKPCLSFVGTPYYHNIRSAGPATGTCVFYGADNCNAGAETFSPIKNPGVTTFGSQNAHWGSVKCSP